MKAEKNEPSIDESLTLEQFQETVLQEQLTPLWMGAVGQLREPRTHIEPYLWRWKELRQRVLQSLKLIPLGVEGAERRVLTLRNPGIPVPRIGTTHTLIAAIQVIAGTEVAPSHRHTMAALRFIIEGEGACTVVNGEPESMQPRDLLLTPNWYWHGHFSEHPEPMIWLDGLDVPLVQGLGATFQENYPSPDRRQPITAPRDESIRRYSAGGLLPVGERTANKNSPLLNFRWAQTEDRLAQMAERDGSPYDGVALQYTNPVYRWSGDADHRLLDSDAAARRANQDSSSHGKRHLPCGGGKRLDGDQRQALRLDGGRYLLSSALGMARSRQQFESPTSNYVFVRGYSGVKSVRPLSRGGVRRKPRTAAGRSDVLNREIVQHVLRRDTATRRALPISSWAVKARASSATRCSNGTSMTVLRFPTGRGTSMSTVRRAKRRSCFPSTIFRSSRLSVLASAGLMESRFWRLSSGIFPHVHLVIRAEKS